MPANLNRSFRIDISDRLLARNLCHEYLAEYGFKLLKETEDHLMFKRGSSLRNLFTFNPLKWKTEVNIKISSSFLDCDFSVSTIGQVPTKSEERTWEVFSDNLEKFLIDPSFGFKQENQIQLRKAKTGNWTYLKEAILVGVLVAIPLTIIGEFLGVNDLAPAVAAVGAGIAIAIRVQKEKTSK